MGNTTSLLSFLCNINCFNCVFINSFACWYPLFEKQLGIPEKWINTPKSSSSVALSMFCLLFTYGKKYSGSLSKGSGYTFLMLHVCRCTHDSGFNKASPFPWSPLCWLTVCSGSADLHVRCPVTISAGEKLFKAVPNKNFI